jgi:hypothetical protein
MLVIDGGSHDNGNGDTQNAIQDSNENEQWQGTKYEYVRDFILVPVANFYLLFIWQCRVNLR